MDHQMGEETVRGGCNRLDHTARHHHRIITAPGEKRRGGDQLIMAETIIDRSITDYQSKDILQRIIL